mgnify:FL=1
MKRIITLITLVLVSASTLMYAQSSSETRQAERKAQREAQKAREKAENERNYTIAVQALKEGKFVLEADQLVFKRGRSAFVSSTTNFVLMDGEHASVQIAANNALAGPNGIGGITVDGSRKEMKITTDKKGNVNCSFSVQGIGISAQVYITLTNGGNNASARISPNFNSNTLTLNGVLVPLSQSNVTKGGLYKTPLLSVQSIKKRRYSYRVRILLISCRHDINRMRYKELINSYTEY